jgi:hypothetical protein
MRAKPTMSFATRVDPATDERRRRIQALTGLTTPDLIKEAMKLLEARLQAKSISEPAT